MDVFNILVVDNEVEILAFIEIYLANSMTKILTAPTLKAANLILETAPVDIIICDQFFEGPLGTDWLKVLRTKGCKAFFILFTGCYEAHAGNYESIGDIETVIKTDFISLKTIVGKLQKKEP